MSVKLRIGNCFDKSNINYSVEILTKFSLLTGLCEHVCLSHVTVETNATLQSGDPAAMSASET